MIYDGKITKLDPHPFKEGYYVGEILTDGGRGCNFEMNPRRAEGYLEQFPFTRYRGVESFILGGQCWVEIDDETNKVLDWGI